MEKFTVNLHAGIKKKIYQPDSGYRFSEDPFLLAAHVKTKGEESVLDIGTGCGILPLILSSRDTSLKITGVEIQAKLCQFAIRNVEYHGFTDQIHIINSDIADFRQNTRKGFYDIILSNPPYKKIGSGRLNPDSQKAIARHEIHLNIDGVFKSAGRLLKPRGNLYVIFPAERIDDLILTMKEYGFSALYIRFVHTRKEKPAKRIILNAVKSINADCSILPAWYTVDTTKIHSV